MDFQNCCSSKSVFCQFSIKNETSPYAQKAVTPGRFCLCYVFCAHAWHILNHMKIVNVTFQEYNVNILSKLALSTLSFLKIKNMCVKNWQLCMWLWICQNWKIVCQKTCRHIFCTSALLSTMYVYVAIHVCCVWLYWSWKTTDFQTQTTIIVL